MKYLGLALIFGWFFAVQTRAQTPGAFITTTVGPFQSEESCKAEHSALIEMLESFGIKYAEKKCAYTQES